MSVSINHNHTSLCVSHAFTLSVSPSLSLFLSPSFFPAFFLSFFLSFSKWRETFFSFLLKTICLYAVVGRSTEWHQYPPGQSLFLCRVNGWALFLKIQWHLKASLVAISLTALVGDMCASAFLGGRKVMNFHFYSSWLGSFKRWYWASNSHPNDMPGAAFRSSSRAAFLSVAAWFDWAP